VQQFRTQEIKLSFVLPHCIPKGAVATASKITRELAKELLHHQLRMWAKESIIIAEAWCIRLL
jgi:hypothetical protein